MENPDRSKTRRNDYGFRPPAQRDFVGSEVFSSVNKEEILHNALREKDPGVRRFSKAAEARFSYNNAVAALQHTQAFVKFEVEKPLTFARDFIELGKSSPSAVSSPEKSEEVIRGLVRFLNRARTAIPQIDLLVSEVLEKDEVYFPISQQMSYTPQEALLEVLTDLGKIQGELNEVHHNAQSFLVAMARSRSCGESMENPLALVQDKAGAGLDRASISLQVLLRREVAPPKKR